MKIDISNHKWSVARLFLLASGLVILIYLINLVGITRLLGLITDANVALLTLGITMYVVVIFIRSQKWFFLLNILDRDISYRRFIPIYLAGMLLSNVTPMKSGESIIPIFLKKQLKVPIGKGFSVIAVDRFFEFLTLSIILLFSFLYILYTAVLGDSLRQLFSMLAGFFLGLLLISFFVLVSKNSAIGILKSFKSIKHLSGFNRLIGFLEEVIIEFYDGLRSFRGKKIYRVMFPLTVLGWIFELTSYYLVFASVFPIFFLDVMISQSIGAGASLVSFIPGGLGVGEVSVIYILAIFGHPTIPSTEATLLSRFFLTGTLILMGVIGVVLLRKR